MGTRYRSLLMGSCGEPQQGIRKTQQNDSELTSRYTIDNNMFIGLSYIIIILTIITTCLISGIIILTIIMPTVVTICYYHGYYY